jgi:hypothetical protein
MATEIQCAPRPRQSCVFVTKKARFGSCCACRQPRSPSRSTRGCVQNNRGHPHSQRPRLAGPGLVRVISSKGSLVRLVLVEALDQRVHVLCHKHICAAAPGFFSTSLPRSTHSLAAASLTSTMRQQLAAANMAPVARAAMYPQARGSVVIVTAKPRSRSHVPMAARVSWERQAPKVDDACLQHRPAC